MKRKLKRRLVSLMLSGILLVSDIQVPSVYAAEETAAEQESVERTDEENTSFSEVQDIPSEQMTENAEEEITEKENTEKETQEKESSEEETAEKETAEKETIEKETAEKETQEEDKTADETESDSSQTEEAASTETLAEEMQTEEDTTEAETTEEVVETQEIATEETFTEEESIELAEEEVTDVPTPQQAYERMIALQEKFPEGMYWTDASSGDYRWKGGRGENGEIAEIGTGCANFAFQLSDAAFGNLPARMLISGTFTFEDIRVGDIIRTQYDRHSVIVLQVNDDTVVLAEGNYNKSIHWGRIMTKAEVEVAHYILTRYPIGYIPPDDPTADEIVKEDTFGDGLTWKLIKAGTLTITGSGAMPDFNYGGTSDTPVSDRPWNDYIGQVQKIVIEDGVTNIGSNAFRGSIAFNIAIPNSVKSIGDNAFRECKNLTFVAPEGVVKIGENTFRGCENLKGITIPGSIENVGAGAFFDCTELKNAKFISGTTAVTMGDDAFARCWNLSDVTLPKGMDRISKRMFENCRQLATLSIPEGVTVIDEGAFRSCGTLTTVYIPKSVTEIQLQAFTYCGLTDIYYDGSEAEWNKIKQYGDTTQILSTIQSSGKIHYNISAPAEKCTVIFDVQEHGIEPTAVDVDAGSKIAKPDDPSEDGWTFGGWYKEAACQNAWNFDTDTVESDITLYAKWTKDANIDTDIEKDNDDSRYPSDKRTSLKSINATIANIKSKVYDGTPYRPTVKVTFKDGKKTVTLTEGADYRVLYEKNVEAGTGKVIVRGNGIYTGEIPKDFEIKKKSIKKLNIITGGTTADAKSNIPVTVYDGTKLLKEGADYTLSGLTSINKKQTSAKVTVTGIGNYQDSVPKTITLYNVDSDKIINPENVTLSAGSADYTGKAITSIVPTVTVNNSELRKNKDYKVQYKNNTKAGTALVIVTGKGQYKGKVIKSFTINASKNELTVKSIPDKTYNGKLQKPTVTVKDGNKKLKLNRDYTVIYKNNFHAGTADVIIKGIGNYEGAVTEAPVTFTIAHQKMSKVSVKATKKNGIVLTYNKKTLTEGIDYKLEYGENKKGKVEVTFTAVADSDFTGEVKKSIKKDIIDSIVANK